MTILGKVLVVDDELDIREVLADLLETDGYAVALAARGDEALEYLQRDPPDLVLLDIRMHGVNGLEVLRRFRRDHPAIPVIMLTGIQDEALARSTLTMGAFDYVQKPFDSARLRHLVLAALGKASPERRV